MQSKALPFGELSFTPVIVLKASGIKEKLTQTAGRQDLIKTLIDRHGTGRVMFKNTRRTVGGFPGRRVHLVPLDVDGNGVSTRRWLNLEAMQDCGLQPVSGETAFKEDPRVAWLENYLRDHREEETLLICRPILNCWSSASAVWTVSARPGSSRCGCRLSVEPAGRS